MKSSISRKTVSRIWIATLSVSALLFVLKRTHVVDWSWWWVLSPLIAFQCLSILVIAGVVVFFFVDSVKSKQKKRELEEYCQRVELRGKIQKPDHRWKS